MTTDPVTVQEGATLKEAIALLARHRLSAMPVLDDARRVVGVISEADVIRDMVLADPRAHEIPVHESATRGFQHVADVMSGHPVTVTSDAELASAVELLTSTVVKSVPVVDRGRLVGMLSRSDVIRVLARGDEAIEAEVDELFRLSEKDWLVEVADGIAIVEGPRDAADEQLAEALVATVAGVVGVRFRSLRSPRPTRP
jgi:CBS domain-containing protein